MRALETFTRVKNPIIGALHFNPLIGYEGFTSLEEVLQKAIKELVYLENGGVDSIILENNYDLPHSIIVGHETVAAMTFLGEKLAEKATVPLGISVLWNDYEAALSIAKVIGARYIRVPVFVDTVETSYGIVKGNAASVIAFREKIQAEGIGLFTDIHVKHAKLLSSFSIEESAALAIKSGSDALIITGKWTGDAPQIEELEKVRKSIGEFPIIIGSGADENNIKILRPFANGVIVSTALKTGVNDPAKVNIKGYNEIISQEKTQKFVEAFRGINI